MANSRFNIPNSNVTGKKNWILLSILGLVILLPYVGLFVGKAWFDRQQKQIENATFVVVDKQTMSLRVYDYKGKERMNCPATTGKNYGNKQIVGDFKTPEGIFLVEDIQDASKWDHDFGDGLGAISGSYGPWFIRLNTPGHKGIGIHGTHKPAALGTRDSEGCIRVENKNIEQLKTLVQPGSVVIVLPGQGDVIADLKAENQLDSLITLVNQAADNVSSLKAAKSKSKTKAPDPVGETRKGKRKR